MKNITTILIMVFALNIVSAQNWKPINANLKYNYSDVNCYYTVWVDSVKCINNDSVFYLNKVIKKVKIGDGSDPYYAIDYYKKNQSQFFLSDIIYSANNDIIMKENDSVKFLIKPYSGLSDKWVFDSLLNDTAKVVDISTMMIFGNIDSVKIIRQTSNDSIILSKNYGIIKFPANNLGNQYVNLVGIEDQNLGVLIPKFQNFFDYNIGDVFYDKYQSYGRWYDYFIYKKATILSKEINGDTIKYNMDFKSKNIVIGHYGYSNDTSYLNNADSLLVFVDNNDHFLNKYNYQPILNGVSGMNYKPVNVLYDSTYHVLTKSYHYYPFCEINSDTIVETSNLTWCSFECHSATYGNGIGTITKSNFIYNGSPWPSLREREDLIGYMKSGINYGTILNDSMFLSTPTLNNTQLDLKVYPNPTKDNITIETQFNENEIDLIIYNLNGLELLKQQIKDNKTQINISNLESGVYYLKLITDKKVTVRKIIKV